MTIRVGISVVTHQGQNIWQNGLGQNVIFLAEALQRLRRKRSLMLAIKTRCRRKSICRLKGAHHARSGRERCKST